MTNTTDPDRQRCVLANFSDQFLRDRADQPGHKMHAAATWELARREHEQRREILHRGHHTPLHAAAVRPGMVLRTRTRLVLVREAYELTLSQRVVLGVSALDRDGRPAERVEELPAMSKASWVHLVTRDASHLAPYAVPMPEIQLPQAVA